MNEFELIKRIKNLSKSSGNFRSAARVGIGDDCAVISQNAKTDLVITTDLLVEDVDFKFEWSKPEFIGHKSLAVSLSDVAAMGAKPLWSMTSIGIPEKVWKTDFVERFYDGYLRLAKKFNVELVGGDVSKTPDKIVIDSIVAGEANKNKAILRSNAKIGDLVFVTGKLGGAAAGLKILQSCEKFEQIKNKKILLRQLAPNPQTEIGQIIGSKNLATAMIDLSDGLSSDLAHICYASKVGAKIYADKIPFDPNLNSIVKTFEEKIELALNGGEDFELLFIVSQKKYFRVKETLANHSFSCIGQITANEGIIELIAGLKTTILGAKGFRHF